MRGGTNRWVFASEPGTLDIHVAGSALNTPRCMVYSDLIQGKPGHLAPQQFSEYLPDLAESWEVSPDKLQITFKLRDGVKWHNKPPVNGRAMDMEDVCSAGNGSSRAAAFGQRSPTRLTRRPQSCPGRPPTREHWS
jgi:hypothetical protein